METANGESRRCHRTEGDADCFNRRLGACWTVGVWSSTNVAVSADRIASLLSLMERPNGSCPDTCKARYSNCLMEEVTTALYGHNGLIYSVQTAEEMLRLAMRAIPTGSRPKLQIDGLTHLLT